MLKPQKTNRGFKFYEFTDLYGQGCSLQESSIATENAVWFGVDEPTVKILRSRRDESLTGWEDVSLPDGAQIGGRMHLTLEQVKELLPHLIRFVKKGRL